MRVSRHLNFGSFNAKNDTSVTKRKNCTNSRLENPTSQSSKSGTWAGLRNPLHRSQLTQEPALPTPGNIIRLNTHPQHRRPERRVCVQSNSKGIAPPLTKLYVNLSIHTGFQHDVGN